MKQLGYLDIHSHILPGIDDGSKDWEMTKQMLKMAYEQGVRQMIATPHNYPGNHKQDNEKIKRLAKEADKLAKQIAPDFQVFCGNEVFYRRGIEEEIERGHVLTMAGSRYILVEFYPNEQYGKIYQGLKELVEEGYYPIIAHMERVQELFESEEKIRDLRKLGVLFQVNSGSFMGGVFDRRPARLRKYVNSGFVHFLGSDCHNLTTRPPRMKDCVEKLSRKLPASCMDRLLYENQEQFLQKKYI